MTRADLIAFLARRKVESDLSRLDWADVVAAVQAMSAEEKAAIVAAVRARQNTVGLLLIDAVLRKLATDAAAAVAEALADNALTVAELQALVP